MHQRNQNLRFSVSIPIMIILSLVILAVCLFADNGKYRNSPHGSTSDGILRTADYPRGSCAQCHTAHPEGALSPYGLFQENSNRLCFVASSGGCHADRPAGATSGYPAQESDRMPAGSSDPGYFEYNNGGIKIPGAPNLVRWPGQIIWENVQYSTHFSDPDMPTKDAFGNGACDNCHNIHGGASLHDMLDTTYSGITGSQSGFSPQNYTLCLSCHNINGPSGMNETSKMIAYSYDRSVNPGARSGHGISTGGGYVPSGARLPCYDCHNPHGSVGNGELGANDFLLSDQRPGWDNLTDIKNDNLQVRRFCFGCHVSSDGMGGGPVEGITLSPLPNTVSAHQRNGTDHCYNCHGKNYSTPDGNNVHNPSPGGDCITCHSRSQGTRRSIVPEFALNAHHVIAVGQTGAVTNNDCGVCHMEGNASTGAIDGNYHRNGQVELRNPDNGMSLAGFSSFTRDLYSASLEFWVTDVQNDFCLKCHDADGASSPNARVPGGSPLAPFSDGNAAVIDVAAQFSPTNANYHPVTARGDNPYAIPGSINSYNRLLLPPFNQAATHDLISCFDCHETSGHGGANSGNLRTETYFRYLSPQPGFADAQRTFCGRCHDLNVYTVNPEFSRFKNHDESAHLDAGGSDQNRNAMSCRGCHSGIYDYDLNTSCNNGSGIGKIHGSAYANPACSPTPGTQPPSLILGGYVSGWKVKDAQKNLCYANCHHRTGQEY